MSWAESENGGTEGIIENPEPEEDSDLPARQLHGQGEGEGARLEQDRPEDDLAIAAVETSGDQALGGNEERAEGLVGAAAGGGEENHAGVIVEAILGQSGDVEDSNTSGNNSVCRGGNPEEVARVVSSDRGSSVQPNQLNGADRGPLLENMNGIQHPGNDQNGRGNERNDEIEEEDSFEQDEEGAAPECETDVHQDSTSESDRQPMQSHELEVETGAAANVNYEVSLSSNALVSNSLEHGMNSECPGTVQVETPRTTNSNVSPFSGNIEVSDSTDDAPEAELASLPLRDAGSPANSVAQANAVADFPPQATGPEGQLLHAANSSSNHSNPGPSPAANEDHEMQAPECDRENSPQPPLLNGGENVSIEETSHSQAVSNDQPCCDDFVASNSLQEAIAPMPTNTCQQQSTCDLSSEQVTLQDVAQEHGAVNGTPEQKLQTMAEHFSMEPETNASGLGSVDTQTGISESKKSHAEIPQESSLVEPSILRQSQPSSGQCSGNTVSPLETSPSPSDQNTTLPLPSSVPLSTITKTEQKEQQAPKVSNSSSTSLTTLNNANASAAQHKDDKAGGQKYPSTSSSSSSSNTSQRTSPAKAVAAALFHVMGMDSKFTGKDLALALQSDDEDDLMSELDAELLSAPKPKLPEKQEQHGHFKRPHKPKPKQEPKSSSAQVSNGLPSSRDVLQLQEHNRQLLEQLRIRDEEIARLSREQLTETKPEQKTTEKPLSSHSPDDLYLPQIKELERTIAQQGAEIKSLSEKLFTHDAAAKRTVLSLQNEMKSRVDQATKVYEECRREKDKMVVKFAEAEAKNMEAKKMTEKSETKVRDAFRERDSMASALKAAKADRQRAIANYDGKCTEVTNIHKELEKMKEAVNSAEYRIKWFQNKLKDELEAHKDTKGNLEKTNLRLKEAREETELIRKECQAIVKRYQESEEIKSNSLEKDLKLKESELQTHLQERNDSQELHQMLQQELESLKSQHKDTLEETKTLRDKVTCLEDERQQNHSMIENYQEIMQRQKSDNTDLTTKLNGLATLEDDYKRAQNMIGSLDKDISDLKVTNRDLQKDMDSCRERESKMLTLQSELSRANAMLRSENTNLTNKAEALGSEVDLLKMQVEQLAQQVRELTENLEKQNEKHKENTDDLVQSLSQKTKESSDFKQKWEDEMDNSKTLKRRHANNIKDLTRQLQQARRKLEAHEGKADSGSMGSRTNSNGSLNSVDNSQHQHHNQHLVQSAPLTPSQEFPVIREQVEVDKNVLIEKIVRLQKSHARKNEKLEFLGEHIQQLLEEIKKKTKIIQTYALREESGTLSSDDMDAHKTLLAKKGGIMGSVYSVHQQDGSMTLELSLQINKKLQAVLEDTLLKNITLKENLDTLGEEIARLSQENRRLQLHLQGLEKKPR